MPQQPSNLPTKLMNSPKKNAPATSPSHRKAAEKLVRLAVQQAKELLRKNPPNYFTVKTGKAYCRALVLRSKNSAALPVSSKAGDSPKKRIVRLNPSSELPEKWSASPRSFEAPKPAH